MRLYFFSLLLLFWARFAYSVMVVDGQIDDWTYVKDRIIDERDIKDKSGDIKSVQATVFHQWNRILNRYEPHLYLRLSVYGNVFGWLGGRQQHKITPDSRYFYYWLIDVDHAPETGFKNTLYDGQTTQVKKPIGGEIMVMIGWKDGRYIGVYGPSNRIITYQSVWPNPPNLQGINRLLYWQQGTCLPENAATYASQNHNLEVSIPLSSLGLEVGKMVGISAFQICNSDQLLKGRKVMRTETDWTEPMDLRLVSSAGPIIVDWLWMTIPTDLAAGEASLDLNKDWFAEISNGELTERHVAVNSARVEQIVGQQKWTPGKLSTKSRANITDLIQGIGLSIGDNENVVVYAVTRVWVKGGKCRLHTGSSGPMQIWLNGEVVEQVKEGRVVTSYQQSKEVSLKRGENRLMVASYGGNSNRNMFVGFDLDLGPYNYGWVYASVEPLEKQITTWSQIRNSY